MIFCRLLHSKHLYMAAISTDKLTKNYGKARGITGLDLCVEEGDFFGFIGPNGAGKSTTIRTLLGLIMPSSGSAKIFGKDAFKDSTSILGNVGYLPSETNFYPEMKVSDILELSAKLRQADCSSVRKELCERLNLDCTRKAKELSFGNKKKVAIVAALQHKPKLLILDEPTGGFYPIMQQEFFNILKEYHNSGSTIFLSSHILSEVQNNCNKAAIIREGRMVACDSIDRLMQTQSRKVTVKGRIDITRLPGIKEPDSRNGIITFIYEGDMRPLLEELAKSDIKDLHISEPSLEEIFMHYYK